MSGAPDHGARIPVNGVARRLARDRAALTEALHTVIDSGTVLLGPQTAAFEDEFARYTGHRHAVAVASGTEALRLVLVALGVGPGSEVIIPALTAVPTAAAVAACGAEPVPVDVDPTTATMDWDAARRARTSRTRAVIPVHLYGRPCAIDDIGVPVVGDAAQAHGAVVPGGTVATAYSFYPTKNLGGIGDGGAVVTDDADLAERIRLLRVHGNAGDYLHVERATNARLSELEAAALRIGLRTLDEGNARRRAIARRLREAAPHLHWQADHERHVYHLLVVRHADRDAWRATLPFETAVHYARAITEQPAYATGRRGPCPHAEAWAAECVSLPCFPELTDGELDVIAEALACSP